MRIIDKEKMRELAAQGLSSEQIAAALDSTAGTIRVLCCRAKIKIKRGPRTSPAYKVPNKPPRAPQTEARQRLRAIHNGNPWD